MNWYEANTGNYEGLIIDEDTGDNIAVSYDKKSSKLIASAPDLLYCLKRIIDELPSNRDWLDPALERLARDAIKKAE